MSGRRLAPRRIFRAGREASPGAPGPARPAAAVLSSAPVCMVCHRERCGPETGWEVFTIARGPLAGGWIAHCPDCTRDRPEEVMAATYDALGLM